MSLSTTALVDLITAKNYLRIDAAASLKVDAEYVGVGDDGEEGTKVFTLDNTPIDGSLKLYLDGTLQVETTDYTIVDMTITFVTAPASPKVITASYDKEASANTFDAYDDAELESLIEAATKIAERSAGCLFVQDEITEDRMGNGDKLLRLHWHPVDSITSVVRVIEEIVGTGDGSTVEFTLAETPTLLSVKVYVDGTLKTVTTHYTISGATITFVSEQTPTDGAKVTARYTHTILAISEFVSYLAKDSLYLGAKWVKDYIYRIVYTAGYGADRAAAQVEIPDVVTAVLLILGDLYENRGDTVDAVNISGLGSTSYKLPSRAARICRMLRPLAGMA